MDKILVTGCAGFLGSNLIYKLLEDKNNQIIGVDNFSSSNISALYPFLRNEQFTYFEHDLIEPIDIIADKIYHLAGCGDLKHYFDNKYDFILKQIKIFENITNIAKISGAKLILLSQYLNYQDYNKNLHLYFDTIKLIENLALELINKNKLNANIARIDYVYGKNFSKDDNRFIIKNTINAFKNVEIIEEYDESFYFTNVSDVTNGLINLMDFYHENQTIDIINDNLYLKSDIIKLILKMINSNSKLILKSNEVHHPNYRPIKYENFSCNSPLEKGLKEMQENVKLMYFS